MAGFGCRPRPKTSDELLQMSVADAATYLAEYEPKSHAVWGADRPGLMTILQQTAANSPAWSLSVARELIAREVWRDDLWTALVGAWHSTGLNDLQWKEALDLLDTYPGISKAAPMSVANLAKDAFSRTTVFDTDIGSLERIGERLLEGCDEIQPGVSVNGEIDWLTSAINHPAGQVALTWLKAVSKRMDEAGDEWRGLSNELRVRFDTLLQGTGANAQLARIIFASEVHFLFSADQQWTKKAVVPLFDWETDAVRAKQAWSGFRILGAVERRAI